MQEYSLTMKFDPWLHVSGRNCRLLTNMNFRLRLHLHEMILAELKKQ